jgi:hypothetical protein
LGFCFSWAWFFRIEPDLENGKKLRVRERRRRSTYARVKAPNDARVMRHVLEKLLTVEVTVGGSIFDLRAELIWRAALKDEWQLSGWHLPLCGRRWQPGAKRRIGQVAAGTSLAQFFDAPSDVLVVRARSVSLKRSLACWVTVHAARVQKDAGHIIEGVSLRQHQGKTRHEHGRTMAKPSSWNRTCVVDK